MSETQTPPAPVPTVEPPPALPPVAQAAHKARRALWPFFFLPGFLLLAGGEAYLWTLAQHQVQAQARAQAPQATAVAVLQAQVADLRTQAARAQPAPDSVTVQADLAVKFAALAAQVNAVQAQMAADHGALTTLQANSIDLTRLAARMTLLNQLETARMALDAGLPLGTLPGAPPALAQFATAAPPREADLRLSFPDAARAVTTASIAGNAQGSYWSRVLARLEDFVTISEGSRVLVGSPAAGVIAQAGALLQAGDLAGAVARLDTLSLPAQQAMGGWLAQARALLAARAALIAMAGQA